MKTTLSVVLATHNEEKNLPDCLESVKDLADEICIVDGTSTDKTVEIAKKYGAKVLVTDNPLVFHINKQKAIDMAAKDWVLQLDADERVTPELAGEIKKVIAESSRDPHIANVVSQDNKKINGYWIPRKNWFLGRYLMKGGVYPDYTLRLYKRGKGKLPQKDVHEQAVVEGKVGYLQQPLIHIADPDFGRYLKRFDRYTNLIVTQHAENHTGKNIFSLIKYTIVLPCYWFILAYGRHKGFLDGWQGFVFAFFSAMRFPVGYVKFLQKGK